METSSADTNRSEIKGLSYDRGLLTFLSRFFAYCRSRDATETVNFAQLSSISLSIFAQALQCLLLLPTHYLLYI